VQGRGESIPAPGLPIDDLGDAAKLFPPARFADRRMLLLEKGSPGVKEDRGQDSFAMKHGTVPSFAKAAGRQSSHGTRSER